MQPEARISLGGSTRNVVSRCERRSAQEHRSYNADHEREYYITRLEWRSNTAVGERTAAVRVSGYEVERRGLPPPPPHGWRLRPVIPLPYTSNNRNQVASCQPCRPVKTRSFRIVIVALPFMVPQLPPTATNCGYYSLPWQRPLLIIIIKIYTQTPYIIYFWL